MSLKWFLWSICAICWLVYVLWLWVRGPESMPAPSDKCKRNGTQAVP